MNVSREVTPEILDGLDAEDPQALRARRDLRRVHTAMRSVSILRGAVARLRLERPPRRILELGAGDGDAVAALRAGAAAAVERRRIDPSGSLGRRRRGDPQCLPRIGLAGDGHAGPMRSIGAAEPCERSYDLCFASLFLHHFESAPLAALLRGAARASHAFVACEPRRTRLAHWGSRLIALLGANRVTRQDAVASVAAGFSGRELSDLWPGESGGTRGWRIEEYAAPPFTHCFVARAAAGGGDAYGI